MPIFEFVCNACNYPFEELMRSSATISEVVCPACGSDQVKKQLSSFASKIHGNGSLSLSSNSASTCSPGGT